MVRLKKSLRLKAQSKALLKRIFRITIGTKLTGLIAGCLLISIGTLTWLNSQYLGDDNRAQIQSNSTDLTLALSRQLREVLVSLAERTINLGRELIQLPESQIALLKTPLTQESSFLGVFILEKDKVFRKKISSNHPYSSDPEFEAQITSLFKEQTKGQAVEEGSPQFQFVQLPDQANAIAIFTALKDYKMLMLYRTKLLEEILDQFSTHHAMLVNQVGNVVLSGSGENLQTLSQSLSNPVVTTFIDGKRTNDQQIYMDKNTGTQKLASLRVLGLGGLAVVTEVPEGIIFRSVTKIKRTAINISIGILALSVLVGYLFSLSLSWPIRLLSHAAERIARGDFKIALTNRGRDELGHLSRTFNQMAKDLEHREQVIDTFHKFHSQKIAEKLLSGEVKLGGERKNAVIFFSDIRGFTSLSERMQPEQVVEMLNEYMTVMVTIIDKHHGVVDKFVGDAIMAIWGVPMGSPVDAKNAVTACLEMKQALVVLNHKRVAEGKEPIHNGMGLNLGEVIAGQIGSTERMEYTVIGDAVNLASRIESATKELNTDFLISESLKDAVKGLFQMTSRGTVKVKGKAEPVTLYEVSANMMSAAESVKPQLLLLPQLPPTMWHVKFGLEITGPFPEKNLKENLQHFEHRDEALLCNTINGFYRPVQDWPQFAVVTSKVKAAS